MRKRWIVPLVILLVMLVAALLFLLLRKDPNHIFSNAYLVWQRLY